MRLKDIIMINIELFEQYTEIQETIENEAMLLLKEINDIEEIKGCNHLNIKEIYDGTIEFFGEEHWRYGGYESYEHELPSNLLYDEAAKTEYLNKIKIRVQEKLNSDSKRIAKNKLEQEIKDKAKYLELKSQFEDAGE
jgi:hypothetical protein